MPRRPRDTPEDTEAPAPDYPAAEALAATEAELADLDARPEENEGNESAMAGRVNPEA